MHQFLAHRAKFKGTFFLHFFGKVYLIHLPIPYSRLFLPYIFISLIFGHSFTYATYLCLRHIISFRMFFLYLNSQFLPKKLHYSVFFSLLHLHFKSIFCSFFCRYFQDQGNPVALEMLEEGIFSVMFCTIFSFFFSQQNLIV